MLNRDEAEKRLKQFQIKDWCGKRVAAVGKLPAPLAQVGRALLGRTQGLSGADALGIVLAAALDDGPEGEDVFETLRRSAGNEHGTGALGRHVTRALLVCGRPDAWEFAEQLLLRDQPEGGLRQVILETLDEAHPEAFRRMLRLILHQDLLRFRGTARAVDVWFGPSWHPPGPRSTPGVLEESLRQVIDQLLGPGEGFADLGRLTRWPPPPEPGQVPGLQAVVECCRDRILEIELGRGEAPTAASGPALALARCLGADLLLRLTQALGKKPFSGNADTSTARGEVLTHLVKVTHPRPADTPEAFTAAVKEAGPPRGRLLELAFTAPQWLAHVEHAVGWKGLREGVWWFLAHTPGASQVLEAGSVNRWERLIRERSPLTDEERGEGAVDVAWFRRAYEPLGKKRWDALAEASKCGSAGDGHRKATLLADVLLGRAKKRDLVAGVRDRKLKESVRLLGLLPLAGGKREADLLGRCKVLQGYRRYARGLGPMSREGALRAYRVGLENLARTAGYPDPLRLEWALEAGEVADLAAGPVAVTHQGVTVTLTLDEQAWAQISARQGNKPLKAIPAAVRKHPTIRALCEREAELKRQAARMRQALESAMCRGDAFTGAELRQLCAHPVPAALLRRLALVGEGGCGYPASGGAALADHAGKMTAVKPEERRRIAHPHDPLLGGEWAAWRRHCSQTEREQPFEQVFRELHLPTEQERRAGVVSRRYAGRPVNPAQARELLGERGWWTRDEVSRTFYEAGLTATVTFRPAGRAPGEGEALDGVQFTRRGESVPTPLEDVPPCVFSEVMRDLDLVVSAEIRGE